MRLKTQLSCRTATCLSQLFQPWNQEKGLKRLAETLVLVATFSQVVVVFPRGTFAQHIACGAIFRSEFRPIGISCLSYNDRTTFPAAHHRSIYRRHVLFPH